jgi:hypothetical protein
VLKRPHKELAVALAGKHHDAPLITDFREKLRQHLLCPFPPLAYTKSIERVIIRGNFSVGGDQAVERR